MLKYFEYLGINNRVVMVKKYRYIKSWIHILCVCCLCFEKVFSVLKFPRSYFLTFFTMMSFLEVLLIQSSFSDTNLWWLPSLTFLFKSSSPARILPHSNKNFWWIVDPQMKISLTKNDPGDTSNICVWRSADDVVLPSMQQNIPTKQLSEMLFYTFFKRTRQNSIDISSLRGVMVASVCNAIQLLLLTFWEKDWNEEEWEMKKSEKWSRRRRWERKRRKEKGKWNWKRRRRKKRGERRNGCDNMKVILCV